MSIGNLRTYDNNKYPKFDRENVLHILKAALECKNNIFAKNTTQSWLNYYPGDIEFQYYKAYALYIENEYEESKELLIDIINKDPEYLKPHELLLKFPGIDTSSQFYRELLACRRVLTGIAINSKYLPDWSAILLTAKQAFENGLVDDAEKLIQKIIGLDIKTALPSIIHMRIVSEGTDKTKQHNLAQLYHSRWPECILFSLIYARTHLELKGTSAAVNILQSCLMNDPAGQVVNRIWESNHPFITMWPKKLDINLEFPIPADVSNKLGWNALPEGNIEKVVINDKKSSKDYTSDSNIFNGSSQNNIRDKSFDHNKNKRKKVKTLPFTRKENNVSENLQHIDNSFYKLEKKINGVSSKTQRKDNRYPIYVILSMKEQLIEKYGAQTTSVIDSSLKQIGESIKNNKGWGSIVFYPDDDVSTTSLVLTKVKENDPWSIKLSLVDLENELSKKGAMIGALLIIGNDDIVPFHRLPNPTDDIDKEVLSDNPYSTLDANYFIPEWPVGRLPGETGSDAGILLSQIRSVIKGHQNNLQTIPWWVNFNLPFTWWRQIQEYLNKKKYNAKNSSIGYTAAVWRRSSISVFRPIGHAQDLFVSPPESSESLDENFITNSNIGYYNLHGLSDSAEWYGQKDVYDSDKGPDYPIALKASEIVKNGNHPSVIFSEACYGGFIIGKRENESVALKLLSIGTPSLIASSCIAYGSIASPLIGADLLGYLLFKGIKEGLTSGEALTRAKIDFVREMNKRQGFLDGEDQKTLISFCLYGDPLNCISDYKLSNKNFGRYRIHSAVNTISDQYLQNDKEGLISEEIIHDVKNIVDEYLPGLQHDKVYIKMGNRFKIDNAIMDKYSKDGNSEINSTRERVLITFKKEVKMSKYTHHHFARATLDTNGKIIKLALSR